MQTIMKSSISSRAATRSVRPTSSSSVKPAMRPLVLARASEGEKQAAQEGEPEVLDVDALQVRA